MTTGTVNYSDVLVQVQKQRKKYAETLDAFHVDVEAHVEDVINCSSSEELWDYRDKLEEIRGTVYKLKKSAARNKAEISDGYHDSVRVSMAGIKNATGTGEERKAKYEMQHITEYKILNNLERMVEDLERFSWYLEGRLNWIKDRQRWLMNNERFNQ